MDDDSGSSEEFHHGTQSSLLDTEDITDLYGNFQFRRVVYQKVDDHFFKDPARIKRKEDMEIKDVVKEHALSFLPAKSLIRFRSVSKEWDQWIMNPFLAYKQSHNFRDISGFFCQYNSCHPTFVTLSRSAYGVPTPSLEFLPQIVAIRSSCNGLLLCQVWDGDNFYYICNPVNKQWTLLPPPWYYHGSEPAIVLAFEPSVLNMEADYQVICAVTLLDNPIVYFEIFFSQTKHWRRSIADCVELRDSSLRSNGFYIKGIAYWLTSTDKVLAFDLKNELAGILYLPSESAPGGILAEMHGELCYICARDQHMNYYTFDIYGGMEMSLKRSISVNLEVEKITAEQFQILAFINGNVLIFVIGDILFSYQMSDQTVRVISRGDIDTQMRCLPYVNSLVNVA